MSKRILLALPGAAILAATINTTPAQSWQEMGPGSATLPTPLRLEALDSSVPVTDRVSIRPELGETRDGMPVLTFYSQDSTGNANGLYSTTYSNGAWSFLNGNERGAVYTKKGFLLPYFNGMPRDYALATLRVTEDTPGSATQMALAFPGIQPLQPYGNAYAAFYSPFTGWAERDDSLDDNGFNGPASFSEHTVQMATALDIFGNPNTAYTEGSTSSQSIYARRYRFGSWVGMGTDLDEAVVPSTNTLTNLHPSLSFSGGNVILVWEEKSYTVSTIKLLRYNPTTDTWADINGSATGGIGAGRRPTAVNYENRDTFYVAYEEVGTSKLRVIEWNGLTFIQLPDPLEPWGLTKLAVFNRDNTANPQPDIANYSLTLDRLGRPAVAFRAESAPGSGQHYIYVSYYNRSAGNWEAVGNPEEMLGASQRAYSLPATVPQRRGWGHYNPSLFIAQDNRPIVAWEFDDASDVTPAIFVRRYSEPVAALPATVQDAAKRILLILEPNPIQDERLDANKDGVIDAADIVELR